MTINMCKVCGEPVYGGTEHQGCSVLAATRETPRNPGIETVIRESLAATASWGWSDDDRKWSAAGAAQKWLEANSTMSDALANGLSLRIVEEMMKEEEPALEPCPYCHNHHAVGTVEQCPMKP